MSWALGFDSTWGRDIGYGVPAICDYPGCGARIDRGLAYVCCEEQPYGGENGCGLYFCGSHCAWDGQCERCGLGRLGVVPFQPTPDTVEWMSFKLTDPSWGAWRAEHVEAVRMMHEQIDRTGDKVPMLDLMFEPTAKTHPVHDCWRMPCWVNTATYNMEQCMICDRIIRFRFKSRWTRLKMLFWGSGLQRFWKSFENTLCLHGSLILVFIWCMFVTESVPIMLADVLFAALSLGIILVELAELPGAP